MICTNEKYKKKDSCNTRELSSLRPLNVVQSGYVQFGEFHMILLCSGEETNTNFAYYSGLGMKLYDHSFLLMGKKKILIVSEMNEKLAKSTFKGKIIVYKDLKKTLKKLIGGKKIGIDGSNLNVRMYNFLKKICKPKDVSKELLWIRTEKNKKEISKLRKAVMYTKKIINSVNLKKCKTENDVARELLRKTAEMGLEIAFKPIVATGKNTSFPHYTPGNVKLKNIVLIDYGVKYEGYCGDITRCFILKKGSWEKDYKLIKKIQKEIIDKIKKVKNSGELAGFVDELYKKYKLPKQLHSLGHGIGLDVHELPQFSKKSKDKLKNTVFTVEPGIYRKGWGVRVEDCVFFNGKKTVVL